MPRFMFIHNGDYKNECPFWTVRVWSDGGLAGEIIGPGTDYTAMQTIRKQLPDELRDRLFSFPPELLGQACGRPSLVDDIIVHYTDPSESKTVFLRSELAQSDPFLETIDEAVDYILDGYDQ